MAGIGPGSLTGAPTNAAAWLRSSASWAVSSETSTKAATLTPSD
jgi:hypothetical protein